jgi:hypothetical protein
VDAIIHTAAQVNLQAIEPKGCLNFHLNLAKIYAFQRYNRSCCERRRRGFNKRPQIRASRQRHVFLTHISLFIGPNFAVSFTRRLALPYMVSHWIQSKFPKPIGMTRL